MVGLKSIGEIADLLGLANLFLNTKQTKQLKVLRKILSNQIEIMKKLEEMEKNNG